jgi:hypothetical protein
MSELTVVTYFWGQKYHVDDVLKLRDGVRRNLRQHHRFAVVSDRPVPGIKECWPIEDLHLTRVPGCFARLRVFDPVYQNRYNIEKLVSLDLDLIVTGNLDELFNRPDNFAILQGINTSNPCPYNGSVWMLRAGYRPDVWTDFSLENYHALKVPFHAIPDDQGWFHYKMPDAGAFGPSTGVYGFKKQGWPYGDDLPKNARIVAFPGWRSPEGFNRLPWIKQNWKLDA